jgi:hypothetical protein
MATYYKQIINSFNSFATTHALVNSFGFGDISRVDVIQYAQGHFPLIYVHTDRDNLQNSVSNYAFQVLVCDKLFDDRSNALDAASTCHQIAIDFISEFRDQFDVYGFELNESNVTINYIEEQYDDWCIGWMINITIRVPDGLSACTIPSK